MNQSVKKIGCIVLSGIVGMSMMPVNVYAQENHPTEKTETVFTVLNGDGSIDSSIVSSWIHDEDGIENIQEDLQLKNVENVKTDEQPIVKGNTYTWNARGNDVYYQGDNEQALPVEISITYELDGKAISAKDLQNQSGHLKVRMQCTPKISRVVQGITIHPSYVLGGALVLEDGTIENVESDQGKIIDDGSRKLFVFATVPGLAQTLHEAGLDSVAQEIHVSDTIEWQADVKNFDENELMLAMSNEMELDGLPQIPSLDAVSLLSQAQSQLTEGSKQLNEGMHQLKDGIHPLTHASDQIEALKEGIVQLDEGSHVLKDGVAQYVQGVKTLDAGNQQLNQIPQGSKAIQDTVASKLVPGAAALELGLAQLEQATDSQSFQMALQQIQSQLSAMNAMVQKDTKALDAMSATLQQVQTSMQGMEQLMMQMNAEAGKIQATISQDNAAIDAYNAKKDTLQSQQQVLLNQIDQAIAVVEDEQTVAQLQAQRQEIAAMDFTDLPSLESIDMTTFNACLQSLQKGIQTLAPVMSTSKDTLTMMAEDIQSAQKVLAQMAQMQEAIHFEELQQAVHDLHAGSMQMKSGVVQLQQALEQLTMQSKKGIEAVSQGSAQLSSKGDELIQGSEKLGQGVGEFTSQSDKVDVIQSKMSELDAAVNQLSEGTQTLYEGECKFEKEGIEVLKEKLDLTMSQVQTLQTILNSISQLNKENTIYSGSPQGAIHTTRFVFRLK